MENLLQMLPGPDSMAIAAVVWWGLIILVHIGFAGAVAAHSRSRATELVRPWLWVVATFACGPLVAVGYWFVNSAAPVVEARGRERPPRRT